MFRSRHLGSAAAAPVVVPMIWTGPSIAACLIILVIILILIISCSMLLHSRRHRRRRISRLVP
jgi:hypothetical protein